MKNRQRYIYGVIIGMCLEYVYRVESDVWYIPLYIAIALIVIAVIDLTKPSK